MLFVNIIHLLQINRRIFRKVFNWRIILTCLAAILVINYNKSRIKNNTYNVTISNNISRERGKNHLNYHLDRVNLTRTKNISTDLLLLTSSSKPLSSSSSPLIKAYSYDLLRHPDAHKLRQKFKDYRKNNETTISCKLEDAKLHPYHAQLKLTALASFPRSGNTWLRTLIEKATGYRTSSIHCDRSLPSFKAECIQSNLFLRKTHYMTTKVYIEKRLRKYDQFIHLIRNPFDAILSYYQFEVSAKNRSAKIKNLHEASLHLPTRIPLSSVAIDMIKNMTEEYYENFLFWQTVALPHIDIRYEDLKQSPAIILRYVRMFLVPVFIDDHHNHTNGTRTNFSYYFDHPSIISATNPEISKYIEEGDKQIACATEEDVLDRDFVYRSNKYESLHSLRYFSNSTIDYIIQSLWEPLCYFRYNILFKDKLNIPCEQ